MTILTFALFAVMLLSQVGSRALITLESSLEYLPQAVILLRVIAYATQNVALTLNIGRWGIVLKSFQVLSSLNSETQRDSRSRVWTWIAIFSIILTIISGLFGALELLKVPLATDFRRYTQALVVHPAFIACYVVIIRRVSRFL